MKHSLYGARIAGVSEVALAIGGLLVCEFQTRESDYIGVYRMATVSEAKIQVVAQPDPEGEPIEDGFEEYVTLVYVDGEVDTHLFDKLLSHRGGLERLRHYE
jgi:hypothetical protein